MKTYVRFIAFTASASIVFVTAYLAQIALDTESEWWLSHVVACPYVPPKIVFEYAIPILRALMIALLTPTIAVKCLRRALPLAVVIGLLDVMWCYALSHLHLEYLAIGINLTQVGAFIALDAFYIRNTRFTYIFAIPPTAAYVAFTALTASVIL